MFPDISSAFWTKILEQKPKANTLALRLLTDRLYRGIELNSVSKEEAIAELYSFFNKYKSMCKLEFEFINDQLK
ncbi:MAG: hypothetical protein AAGC64_05560 [Bacteroidota bacterium]